MVTVASPNSVSYGSFGLYGPAATAFRRPVEAAPTLPPELQMFLDLLEPGSSAQSGLPGQSPSLPNLQAWEMLQLLIDYLAQFFQPEQRGRDLGRLGSSGTAQRRSPGSWGTGSSNSSGGGGSVGTPSSTGPTAVPGNVPTGRGTAGDFLKAALAQKGDRYVFGAETRLDDPNPGTFDCSELVQWAAHQAGVDIADGSWNQKAASKPISVEEAMRTPGALLFKPGHVAISLGDGRTIEAMGSKWGVVVANAQGRFTSGGLIPGMQYG